MFCDPNCSCETPCLEALEDQDDYFFIEEDYDFDDDLCCYDLGYKHGDYCHCKAVQDEHDRQEKWGWILSPIYYIQSIPFRFSTWIWSAKRKYIPQSVNCENCNHRHWFIEHEPKCPKCGTLNLPF